VVVAAVIGSAATAAAGPPEVYPLSKVRRGQTGYGYTTFKGGTPEKFTFEVISVIKNFLPKQDIILVKSEDPKLQLTGWWAGTSGSPMYIDDKLTCAFSYGWSFTKIPFGACTPIQYMKDEGLDVPRRGSPTASSLKGKAKGKGKGKGKPATTSSLTPQTIGTMAEWRRLAPKGEVDVAMGAPRGTWAMQPPLPAIPAPAKVDDQVMTASVPLAVTGFSAPAFAQIEQLFAGYNVAPMNAGGGTAAATDDPEVPSKLQMGGSIAVLVFRGDMSGQITGTVSYLDKNKVLAFGHPMFKAGEIYAPVATAKVHDVVPSAQRPFVSASAGVEVGSVTQDRQSMIAADLDLKDPMIPVDVFVTSSSGNQTDKGEFHVDILDNKFFSAPLASAVAANAIDYYLPDREHVTAKIDSKVKIKGIGEIAFTDYLHASDGAGSVIGGARALRAAQILMMNPYEEIELERVEVKVDLQFGADYGDIKEIRLSTQTLPPGKKSMVTVVMDTYEGGEITEEVPVDVPASLAGSIVQLDISAGDAARLDAAPAVDLESLVTALKKMLPGNVWAATLSVADEGVAVDGMVVKDLPASAQDKLHPGSRTQRAQSYKPMSRTTSPAKRVLNGSASILVRIADK
jgi:hypothetical protein